MQRTEDNGSVKADKERRTETEQESTRGRMMGGGGGAKGNAAEGSVRRSERAKGRPVERVRE